MRRILLYSVMLLVVCQLDAYELREPTVKEIKKAELIASVLVVQLKEDFDGNSVIRSATLDVLNQIKGEERKRIVLYTAHPAKRGVFYMDLGLEAFRYEIGSEYVVVLVPDKDLIYRTTWLYRVIDGQLNLGERVATELGVERVITLPEYFAALRRSGWVDAYTPGNDPLK